MILHSFGVQVNMEQRPTAKSSAERRRPSQSQAEVPWRRASLYQPLAEGRLRSRKVLPSKRGPTQEPNRPSCYGRYFCGPGVNLKWSVNILKNLTNKQNKSWLLFVCSKPEARCFANSGLLDAGLRGFLGTLSYHSPAWNAGRIHMYTPTGE